MSAFLSTPFESILTGWWRSIDVACRKAFLASICINVLAFGFEMTNLTLHHDDVNHILVQDPLIGYYLGRFGHAWFHYVLQNHYVMPFLQMTEGILLMSAYGVLVAHFWGARKPWDLALLSAIVCTFPYLAQVYQYNTTMAAYPAAHLLAALAVVASVRATLWHSMLAAALYVGAFSIYQAVASNAATIFVIWLLARHLFGAGDEQLFARTTLKSAVAALVSVIVGGIVYLVAVSMMNLAPDTIHSSEEAFHLRGALDPLFGLREIALGTERFFRWPENYFPAYLKMLQLVALAAAGVACLRLPPKPWGKLAAVGLLLVACVAPRSLQFLAPKGHFHNLALTAYALVIAAAVMIVLRAARTAARNLSIVVTIVLIGGYVEQSNWISTVNYLNTLAHYTTMTQVLARVRAIPDAHWDGKKIAVVGAYRMPHEYPFKLATGVATQYTDPRHMTQMAQLMRDEAEFVVADQSMPAVLEYAATHPVWPAPGSVGVVDGMGVVVFGRPAADTR